ncbi:MAG: teichoic acid ABC transporter ATP-binding protein [Chloroflexi bacterium 44-23]|nr:MAG: teichoic acid ABC transporter ATP-binding protein [Chloroflexi bacterium 44-23]
MNQKIILNNITVRYKIPSERIGTFKEYIIKSIRRQIHHRPFYALKNISLEIMEGESFGVIGHNGAGKSTMLKLIARVLAPSLGRIEVRGKVSPLLEIGAGFHPELTGRENIFLNGALLGFSRREMDQKLNSIVEFSELNNFIDAPMRTYSSGMWARLGFAVATDSQPDILLVDEVLAVGDEQFQQKCFARIEKFRENGTTIVIVAHGMKTIESNCTRVCWIDHGEIKYLGAPEQAIQEYRSSN